MKIVLGTTKDPNNKLSKKMTNKNTLEGELKDDSVGVVHPRILVHGGQKDNLSGYNYAYIEDFSRYYYIKDIESYRTGLWIINLESDPLMSFKNDILKLPAIISKQETYPINDYYNDGTYVSEERSAIIVKEFDYRFDNNDVAYILTCI